MPCIDGRHSPARAYSWSVTQFSKLRSVIVMMRNMIFQALAMESMHLQYR